MIRSSAGSAGTDVVVSLGGGGLVRATDAIGRLQTLAAMPVLAHVGRAAARVALTPLIPAGSGEAGFVDTLTRCRTLPGGRGRRGLTGAEGERRAVGDDLAPPPS